MSLCVLCSLHGDSQSQEVEGSGYQRRTYRRVQKFVMGREDWSTGVEDQFGDALKDRAAWKKQQALVSQLGIFALCLSKHPCNSQYNVRSLMKAWYLHVLDFLLFPVEDTPEPVSPLHCE